MNTKLKDTNVSLLMAAVCFTAFLLAMPGLCAAADSYKTYANGRFNYSVEYPDIFWSRLEPDNGDGVELRTANGHCSLAVWGQHNIEQKNAKTILEGKEEDAAHIVPDSAASGDGWYTLTTSDDGGLNGVEHYFLEYGIVTEETIAAFMFRYPAEGDYASVISHLKESLTFGGKAGEEMTQFDVRAWEPEYTFERDDEKLYRVAGGEKKFAQEAQKFESEMGIYYWFVVSPALDDVMRGTQSGLYIFYESGDLAAFLPTDDAEFVGELRVSPDAEHILIDFGTSPERDLQLYDFRTMKKKRAFLAMEDIAWLDARRFAMTYIDTAKKARSANAMESGWMSVAIHDTATGKLAYVREATETADFMLNSVDKEARTFAIGERAVKTPKDWADEEKIETREHSVGF